jgi:hypothetical protein
MIPKRPNPGIQRTVASRFAQLQPHLPPPQIPGISVVTY